MSHPAFHQGELPVGPSPIAAGPATELYDGLYPFTQPRALGTAELAGITAQFRAAAERAPSDTSDRPSSAWDVRPWSGGAGRRSLLWVARPACRDAARPVRC